MTLLWGKTGFFVIYRQYMYYNKSRRCSVRSLLSLTMFSISDIYHTIFLCFSHYLSLIVFISEHISCQDTKAQLSWAEGERLGRFRFRRTFYSFSWSYRTLRWCWPSGFVKPSFISLLETDSLVLSCQLVMIRLSGFWLLTEHSSKIIPICKITSVER